MQERSPQHHQRLEVISVCSDAGAGLRENLRRNKADHATPAEALAE